MDRKDLRTLLLWRRTLETIFKDADPQSLTSKSLKGLLDAIDKVIARIKNHEYAA
jgi:hypothetical protein